MVNFAALWSAPEVNPINKKAKSIPVFNPINKYGRVFFFSWWGFMVAFMSWVRIATIGNMPKTEILTLSFSMRSHHYSPKPSRRIFI